MKYLFLNCTWLFLMVVPLCITSISLDPWMPKTAVQKKATRPGLEQQELMMNPLFIFK